MLKSELFVGGTQVYFALSLTSFRGPITLTNMAPKKKPVDDALVAFNFRLSRADATELDNARGDMEEEAGVDLPMAQVLRRICREFCAARRKARGR